MGRTPKIDKETILQAAYEILKESGYAAVNIKTIAARIGCSTQPVSWHFGNMQALRQELFKYCMKMMVGKLDFEEEDPLLQYFEIGKKYLSLACDKPNIFKFVYIDGPADFTEIFSSANLLDLLGDPEIGSQIAKKYNLEESKVNEALRDLVIYTHGLAMLMIWDNLRMPKEKAYELIFAEGMKQFSVLGIDISSYVQKEGKKK